MKRNILIISIILVITVLLTGCGSKKDNSVKKVSSVSNKEVNEKSSDSKILVAYFSKTGENYNVGYVDVGNTALVATIIKDYLNCDSFEIVPVNKYPDNYNKATEVAKKEQNEKARPKIESKLDNIDSYDTIFIGYPIWWGDLPMIMYTFLEEYNFDGKQIYLFNTHEGSGDAGTYNTVKKLLKGANVDTNGLSLQGSVARTDKGKEETISWLKDLGY